MLPSHLLPEKIFLNTSLQKIEQSSENSSEQKFLEAITAETVSVLLATLSVSYKNLNKEEIQKAKRQWIASNKNRFGFDLYQQLLLIRALLYKQYSKDEIIDEIIGDIVPSTLQEKKADKLKDDVDNLIKEGASLEAARELLKEFKADNQLCSSIALVEQHKFLSLLEHLVPLFLGKAESEESIDERLIKAIHDLEEKPSDQDDIFRIYFSKLNNDFLRDHFKKYHKEEQQTTKSEPPSSPKQEQQEEAIKPPSHNSSTTHASSDKQERKRGVSKVTGAPKGDSDAEARASSRESLMTAPRQGEPTLITTELNSTENSKPNHEKSGLAFSSDSDEERNKRRRLSC